MENEDAISKLRHALNDITDAINLLDVEEEPNPNIPPENQQAWGNGNLWKPFADHTGNLVVILREDWTPTQVWAVKSDGSWEQLQYTGRANGNRTHWRGNSPGGKGYANGNKGGGVRVWFQDDFIFIPITGRSRERYGG